MPKRKQTAFICFGDPVVDILAYIRDDLLERCNITAGGCSMVDTKSLDDLISKLELLQPIQRLRGGSAANVAVGLAKLDHLDRIIGFSGSLGEDDIGSEYIKQLEAKSVVPTLLFGHGLTAQCLCLVTPDGQRTMRTCLGAATELQSIHQLPAAWLSGSVLLHIEGYALFRPQLVREAMQAAQEMKAQVSLDLASFEVVRACARLLLELLQLKLIDLVFCNEDEAQELTKVFRVPEVPSKSAIQRAQDFLLQFCKVAVVSLGAEGCVAKDATGEEACSKSPAVPVVDTVGAGDCFTAGFLHAHFNGASLQKCADCGTTLGSASVQVVGAAITDEMWDELKNECMNILCLQNDADSKG